MMKKLKVWGWGIITKIINNTQVQVNIKSNFTSYLPTLIWCKGVFNKSKGYPSLGVIFNSRLYVAYTLCNTTTVWSSCFNDYLNFAPSEIQNTLNFVEKSDNSLAYKYSITFISSEIKEILWLKSTPYYVIAGSKDGIFAFMPLDYNKALSTYNFMVQKLSELGSNGKLVGNNQYIIYENLKNNINILEYDSNSLNPNIVENVLETLNQFKEKTNIHYLALTNFYENIVSIVLSTGKIIFKY